MRFSCHVPKASLCHQELASLETLPCLLHQLAMHLTSMVLSQMAHEEVASCIFYGLGLTKPHEPRLDHYALQLRPGSMRVSRVPS